MAVCVGTDEENDEARQAQEQTQIYGHEVQAQEVVVGQLAAQLSAPCVSDPCFMITNAIHVHEHVLQ